MDTIFRGQESFVITQRVMVISYRCFATAYQSRLQGWIILVYYASSGNFYRRFGTAYGYHLQGSRILGYYTESSGNSNLSVRNYHCPLHNNAEERRSPSIWIRKKVFGPPPIIHKNYFGNVGLVISGNIDLNWTYDLDHISYRILCFSVAVAITINFFAISLSAQFSLSRTLWEAKV
jgi:hypothetical protein